MDILSIDALGDGDIAEILERAEQFFTGNRGRRSAERLHGKIVFNLFYENSTRTAMSFATAAHRLGASAISLSVERSSVQKGETLEDTARTLIPTADMHDATLQTGAVGAHCDKGLLILDGMAPQLGSFVLPGNNYHVYDYALFWGSIRRDAERRLAAWHR